MQFKSAASVLAVCEFCKTTLLKDAASITDLGKMAEVLEDYSPLQIGTSGRFGGRGFSLVGRIQLRYDAGFWNEWYALFDDGSTGWLSDASGQYAMTFLEPIETELPLFDKLAVGRVLHLGGQTFVTSDVRTARCTGGQGELPFKVGQGWEARVADFRVADRFMSLDYSDAAEPGGASRTAASRTGAPAVYMGQAVRLADLAAQLLRDIDRITDSAGRYRGKVTALDCPSCGAPVRCVPGITVQLMCPSCHAAVDTTGAVATVLDRGAAVEKVRFTLELGSEAMIDGTRHAVLGALRRTESDGSSSWNEYFLYAPGRPFVWIVESDAGWQRVDVLDRWPAWDGAARAQLDSKTFTRIADYGARVVFAVGSFNWRVAVGDQNRVIEFENGRERLAAEESDQEITWSRAVGVALDQVRAWFGEHVHAEALPHPPYVDKARGILLAFAAVNAIPLLFAPEYSFPYALLGAAAIYLPAYFLDRLDGRET